MGVWSETTIAALGAASDAIKVIGNVWTLAFGNIVAAILPATAALARFLGLTSLANVIETKPPSAQPISEEPRTRQDPRKTREQINENLRKQLDLENKIAEKGMTQEQIAQRLLATYSAMAAQKKLVESFKTEEGDLQASQLGVEMAQIRERLAGMTDRTGSFQVLADSLQQVGGGGRFAQVGRNEQTDYLRAIKDSSAVSAKALQELAGNGRGSVTPVGVE